MVIEKNPLAVQSGQLLGWDYLIALSSFKHTVRWRLLWGLFHALWGRAIGQANYDKKKWQELQLLLQEIGRA